jgi:hypothetical protein
VLSSGEPEVDYSPPSSAKVRKTPCTIYGHDEGVQNVFHVIEKVSVNEFNSRCTVMPFLMCC